MKIQLRLAVFFLLAFSPSAFYGQKLSVRIIDRQDQQNSYSYSIPGRATTNTYVAGDYVTSNTTYSAPRSGGYSVTGATLSLLIPDGRLVVVNCASKYALKMDYVNRRSCRIPAVNDLEAEFKGNSAKLSWPVSIDGKKFDSETYRIEAVIPTGFKMPPFGGLYSGSFLSDNGQSVGVNLQFQEVGPDPNGFYSASGAVTLPGSPCFTTGHITDSSVAGNFLKVVIVSDTGDRIAFDGYFTDATGNVLSGTYRVETGRCAGDRGVGSVSRK